MFGDDAGPWGSMLTGPESSTKVDQTKVDSVVGELKSELGRNPTAEEVSDRLNAEDFFEKLSAEGEQGAKVDQTKVDDVVDTLKSELGRNPTAEEVSDRLEADDIIQKMTGEEEVQTSNWFEGESGWSQIMNDALASATANSNQVDQTKVDDVVKSLKTELGRDPTPEEVAERLEANDAFDSAPGWFEEVPTTEPAESEGFWSNLIHGRLGFG